MDKRKMKPYRDKLLARRESLFSQVTEAEMSSRERDLEATQDPADMAANAYTKELLISMSANDRKSGGGQPRRSYEIRARAR